MLKASRTILTPRGAGCKPTPPRQDYDGLAVTPSDANDLPGGITVGLLVSGNAGNIAVNLATGGTATLTGLSAGQILDIEVSRVLSTGTTATGVVALY